MPETKKPIFFMHIAKTAGSYVNSLFANALGEESCILHSEHTLRRKYKEGDPIQQAIDIDGVQYISGHVYLKDWLAQSASLSTQFFTLTTIREPISHLASHIQWLDHYNLPEKKREYNLLSEQIKKVVDEIKEIDFNTVGDLDSFLTHLSGSGIQLLDNCQSRYFVCGHGSDRDRMDQLSLDCIADIQHSLSHFDLVLTQDKINQNISNISVQSGVELQPLDARVNSSKSSRMIDTDNKVIRSVLSKRCLVDQWLWRAVISNTANSSINRRVKPAEKKPLVNF